MKKELWINSHICNKEIGAEVLRCIQSEDFSFDEGQTFELVVNFDVSLLGTVEFDNYVLDRPIPNPRNEKQTRVDKINAVLSEQLSKIDGEITKLGIDICSAGINGENLNKKNQVQIILQEADSSKLIYPGKNGKRLKAHSVAASAVQLRETAAEFLAKMFLEHWEKEQKIKAEKQLHTPHRILLKDLLYDVAQGILLDKKLSKSAHSKKNVELAEELFANCFIQSEWPLKIEGFIGGKHPERIESVDMEIDCPKYLLYTQTNGGRWYLEKCENSHILEREMLHFFGLKSCKCVVAMKDGKPLPFDLMQETIGSWTKIDKKDARTYKNLKVLWR